MFEKQQKDFACHKRAGDTNEGKNIFIGISAKNNLSSVREKLEIICRETGLRLVWLTQK